MGIMVHCSPQDLPLKMVIGRILSPKGRKLFIMDDSVTKISALAMSPLAVADTNSAEAAEIWSALERQALWW